MKHAIIKVSRLQEVGQKNITRLGKGQAGEGREKKILR